MNTNVCFSSIECNTFHIIVCVVLGHHLSRKLAKHRAKTHNNIKDSEDDIVCQYLKLQIELIATKGSF